MNTFHDLARRVDGVTAPPVDVDGLIAQGERRLHRRRVAAGLSVIGIVAVIAAGGFVAGSAHHQSNAPVDKPDNNQGHQQDARPGTPATRDIVYSDAIDRFIHFGDRRVPVAQNFLHIDVTDMGFVYTAPNWSLLGGPSHDARVWFSDGGTPEEIGNLCDPSLPREPDDVITANAGSLVAWVDCTDAATPAVVVLDTRTGREVVREPTARFATNPGRCCSLDALIGQHLYLERGSTRHDSGEVIAQGLRLDLTSGDVSTVSPWFGPDTLPDSESYRKEIRANPRGLVIGEDWATGTPTDAVGQPFWVDGTNLVPVDKSWAATPVAATAYDTVTQRPVQLRLPSGYTSRHDALGRGDFWLFEWLGDDTVALVGPTDDIITCQLSDGRCELAATGHGPDRGVGSIPSFPLPA